MTLKAAGDSAATRWVKASATSCVDERVIGAPLKAENGSVDMNVPRGLSRQWHQAGRQWMRALIPSRRSADAVIICNYLQSVPFYAFKRFE